MPADVMGGVSSSPYFYIKQCPLSHVKAGVQPLPKRPNAKMGPH